MRSAGSLLPVASSAALALDQPISEGPEAGVDRRLAVHIRCYDRLTSQPIWDGLSAALKTRDTPDTGTVRDGGTGISRNDQRLHVRSERAAVSTGVATSGRRAPVM